MSIATMAPMGGRAEQKRVSEVVANGFLLFPSSSMTVDRKISPLFPLIPAISQLPAENHAQPFPLFPASHDGWPASAGR
jgi:hypothetical protein